MVENVLEKIINIKSEKILELKKSISLESLEELIKKNSTYVDFKDTIKKVLMDVLFDSSNNSSLVLIPLSEINGPG